LLAILFVRQILAYVEFEMRKIRTVSAPANLAIAETADRRWPPPGALPKLCAATIETN